MRTWFSLALGVLCAAGVSVAPAAAQIPLAYNLTITGDTYYGTRPSGTISGTLGAVTVDGSYSAGVWTLRAYGRPFASGVYTCVTTCRFNGTMLTGRPFLYGWTSPVPTWDARAQPAVGAITGLFASRYEWSAAVAVWARMSGLPPELQTRLIVDAQMGL